MHPLVAFLKNNYMGVQLTNIILDSGVLISEPTIFDGFDNVIGIRTPAGFVGIIMVNHIAQVNI